MGGGGAPCAAQLGHTRTPPRDGRRETSSCSQTGKCASTRTRTRARTHTRTGGTHVRTHVEKHTYTRTHARTLSHTLFQVEYLWVPGTFVQPDRDPRLELVVAPAADGPKRLVTVIPVSLNASGKALTVEVMAFECVYVYACVSASTPVARPSPSRPSHPPHSPSPNCARRRPALPTRERS